METVEVGTEGLRGDLKLLCKPSHPEQSPTSTPTLQILGQSQGTQLEGMGALQVKTLQS